MTCACLLISVMLAAGTDVSVSARAELDPAEIPFHRVARYRVIVEAPADAGLSVEPWADPLPGLEVNVSEPEVTSLPDGRKHFVQELTLTPSMVMNYTLPATRVMADGAEVAVLEARDLVVRALTPEEKAEVAAPAELVSLADLTETGSGRGYYAIALLAFIGATVVAIRVLIKKVRVHLATRVAPTPQALAEARLGDLERQLLSDAIACEALFVGLSQVLRTYLCANFDPTVAGQSSPEFLSDTLPILPLDPGHSGAIRDLLGDFDRVKFAQFSPAREAQAKALRAVRNFIAALENESARRAEQALKGAA